MNPLHLAQTRHTSKAYDNTKKIPSETLDRLLEVLRLTPSSINMQPWTFIVAQSDEAKQNIAKAMPEPFAYNVPKILNASEVIVFSAKTEIDEQHLDQILNHEELAGRFRTPESKQAQKNTRLNYVELYKSQKIIEPWVDNQIHIALGSALISASAEGVDATPIGGFDNVLLDEVLSLSALGLRSVVIMALGYRSTEDFNADLPKARLSKEAVIRFL